MSKDIYIKSIETKKLYTERTVYDYTNGKHYDEDDYLGCCDTREEIAELIYTEGYNAFAVYEATGLLPELKLRKPTQEEVEEMRRQGYRYYGKFEKESEGKTNE